MRRGIDIIRETPVAMEMATVLIVIAKYRQPRVYSVPVGLPYYSTEQRVLYGRHTLLVYSTVYRSEIAISISIGPIQG